MNSSALAWGLATPATILVVDDHPYFAAGLCAGLQRLFPDCQCHEAATLEQALAFIHQHPDLDLLFLDISLSGEDGLSLLDQLRQEGLLIPAVVISSRDDSAASAMAQRRGAMAYLNKSADAATLRETVNQVMSGLTRFPTAPASSGHNLTPRQLEVLALLADGLPNKRICDRLGLTEHTVKSHLKTIFSELGVHNRTECVQVAVKRGLVPATP